MKLVYTGKLRLYFNRHCPRPWIVATVDAGGAELEVVSLETAIPLVWKHAPAVPHSEDGPPRAYAEGIGDVWIDDADHAFVRPVG